MTFNQEIVSTQNAGAEYKACVLTTTDLEPICSTGNNSPALRPEFVDLTSNGALAAIA
jgi:hypothetical protein